MSFIVFMMSAHTTLLYKDNITHSIIKITRSDFTYSFFDIYLAQIEYHY